MLKVVNEQSLQNTEAISIKDEFRACETSMVKLFVKTFNDLYLLSISAKNSIIGVWQVSKYASEYCVFYLSHPC